MDGRPALAWRACSDGTGGTPLDAQGRIAQLARRPVRAAGPPARSTARPRETPGHRHELPGAISDELVEDGGGDVVSAKRGTDVGRKFATIVFVQNMHA